MAARDLESHGFFVNPFLQPGFDVLDAGCGPGTITAGIAEAVFPGRVTAVDLNPGPLECGRRLAEGRELTNLHFIAASAYQLPFEDHSFDVVFAHALLEHLRHPLQAVRELHRVTRPGGFIALASPDWEAFDVQPHSMELGRALMAYRDLQERNGGNTRAGALLRQWIGQAGFTPLTHDEWIEEYEDASLIGEYLAAQLETAGQYHHATTLRNWARHPQARFRQSWKYATGARADATVPRHILVE